MPARKFQPVAQQKSNRLLDALSPACRGALLKHSVAVSLPQGRILSEPQVAPAYCFFLSSGIASTIATSSNGDTAEVGLIGHEGIVGGLQLLGPAQVPAESIVQIEAQALRVPFKELAAIFQESGEVRTRILAFVQNEALTTIQIAACHRLHGTEERLSRWLLMVQDRVQSDELKLTHSFLALMLGIRRPTVTLVARSLQERGLLEMRRGNVRILDRGKLQAIACDCYRTIRDLYDELYRDAVSGDPALHEAEHGSADRRAGR